MVAGVFSASTSITPSSRTIEVYAQAVRRTFSFLKQTARLDDLFAKSARLKHGDGYLIPICELHATDYDLIAKLAHWRAENVSAYPTQFPVTIQGTTMWLRSRLLDVEDRLLFLVVDKHGAAIGHLGFASAINDMGELEIDNVVRGVKDVEPGIMSNALATLIEWAEDTLGPASIFLRVFSDNHHAIQFYRRLGFRNDQLLPLRRHAEAENVFYRPLSADDPAAPDKHFLRMIYSPQRVADGATMMLTAGPSISARETSYALNAVRYGWNHHWSDYLRHFESAFAQYIGTKYAISTSSCTGALHLALAALGIGPGDEVIVPDLTWVATADAVRYVGASPVFADVQPGSWCLDPAGFEAAITEHTKAVIPVHLYGHPAQMDEIGAIARRHKVHVVEDAAPAVGAECRGQKVGTFGDFAAFSFQGAKLLVTGEGGMLVTDNDELYATAHKLGDQGRDPSKSFWIDTPGLKYKMSNIQAAIGLGQLERVDEMIEAKRRIFSWYEAALGDVRHITLNREMPWARSIYWMSSILIDQAAGITRDQVQADLYKRNVDTRPVFPTISQYPIWKRQQQAQPVAQRIGNQGINLPSGVCLKREQVDYVCRCIRDSLSGRM